MMAYFYQYAFNNSQVARDPQKRFVFREDNCVKPAKRSKRYPKDNLHGYGGDRIWLRKDENKTCLWCNMVPSKIIAVIATARMLNVTHIIESGRMGGMSALVYSKMGFDVTSIEYMPVASVELDLKKAAPQIEMMDGDGVKLVPERIESLKGQHKIGVILDGPKGPMALNLAKEIINKSNVEFVALDDFDQNPDPEVKEWLHGWNYFNTDSTGWREAFPTDREIQQNPKGDSLDALYFDLKQDNLIMLAPKI
jgi:hypothetical protein